MSQLANIPLSVLDLSPIVAVTTAADALRNQLDLAQHAESWGSIAIGWSSTTTCPASQARRTVGIDLAFQRRDRPWSCCADLRGLAFALQGTHFSIMENGIYTNERPA